MPNAVWPSQVVHEGHADQHVAEKGGQDCWAHDRLQPLDIEDVHGRGQGESSCREHHTAEHVESDPQAPGKLIVQVGGAAESLGEAHHCSIEARCHQGQEHKLPESELDLHFSLSFRATTWCPSSAAATSSRRCVIHKIPPRTDRKSV